MWSPVISADGAPVPSARNKHASALHGQHLYLFGGRNGNVALKDLWKYNIAENRWSVLEGEGDPPGCLQEHTLVAYRDTLYVFGGEVGFSSGIETPLWMYTIPTNTWKKFQSPKGVVTPKGRRSHTATVYQDSMYIYGGYQDLKGSTSDLWAFHFASETWHLVSQGGDIDGPPPRHRHSAVLHNSAMWVFGGMTDLEERSDFWRFDFVSRRWRPVKSKPGPGCLHSHTAVKFLSVMMLFGGEKQGQTLNEMWRFHFATEFWERLNFVASHPSQLPTPRAQSTAFIFSQFQTSRGTVHYLSLPEHDIFGGSIMDKSQFSNPSSKDTAVEEKRYNFRLPESAVEDEEDAEGNNKSGKRESLTGLWKDLKPRPNNNFQRLDKTLEEDEDPNEKKESVNNNNMLKDIAKASQVNLSRLSHHRSYTVFNNESTESLDSSPSLSPCSVVRGNGATKDTPIKPPDIQNLALKSDEDIKFELQKPITQRPKPSPATEHPGQSRQPKRSDSAFTFQSYDYSSSRSSTLSSNASIQKSGSVQFKPANNEAPIKLIDLEEEESSLSGYESINGSFANPHYMGPDVQRLLETSISHQSFAQTLNSPDESLCSDWYNDLRKDCCTLELTATSASTGRKPPKCKEEETEDLSRQPALDHRVSDSSHASNCGDNQLILLMYILGGREVGHVTVFKRPLSVWKLDLTKTF